VWVGFENTSLDELPQFWNVLVGEMSLVGTPTAGCNTMASTVDVKPGITGEWRVNGRSSVTDFEEVV